jgi:hypothetical protein
LLCSYTPRQGAAAWPVSNRSATGKSPVVIHLEDLAPAALRELHSTLFIGEKGKVLAWDVSKKDARPEVIYQTEKRWKPKKNTDAFALCGGLLVAVDNVMSPKYAFVFRVSEEGPEFLYTGNLPFGVNSQYFEAAGADGKLAILKRFGHRGGSGESVEFFTVTEEGIREVRAFGEFYPREGRGAASEARQLVPGDRSSFHGLEFDGNRLLLGAGETGFDHHSARFKDQTLERRSRRELHRPGQTGPRPLRSGADGRQDHSTGRFEENTEAEMGGGKPAMTLQTAPFVSPTERKSTRGDEL